MSRLTAVYDGQSAENMSKDKLVKAILREYGVVFETNTIRAMEEAFRCGFLRGEEYANVGNRIHRSYEEE